MTGKLVRDKIPAIIQARGLVPFIGTASPGEYRARLAEKLGEEAAEAGRADREHQAEELADVLEVVYAMTAELGLTREDLETIRAAKEAERGGFCERIIWFGNEPPAAGLEAGS
jgi:predicted house-cleaning noncanonical NTP pyrophosphatase (MazG superfamily)